MDQVTIKQVTDLVGGVGVPGALLFFVAWGGVKLIPTIVRFLEGITASLAKIETTLVDVKDEIRELNRRGVSSA